MQIYQLTYKLLLSFCNPSTLTTHK